MESPLSNISDGTVFLSASWSGPSNMALRALQKYWREAGLDIAKLHILDWDKEEQRLSQIPELAASVHGYGEAFHMQNGKIRGFTALGRAKDNLDSEVARFMQT